MPDKQQTTHPVLGQIVVTRHKDELESILSPDYTRSLIRIRNQF